MNGTSNQQLIEELERKAEKLHNSTRTDLPFLSPVHNYLRSKSNIYYRWSSSSKTSSIHKAGTIAFVVSFVFFIGIQFFFPEYFSGVPKESRGVSFKLEEPDLRPKEVSWDEYKKARQTMKDIKENPDGTLTADIYTRPVQYLSDDGQWKDIDINIKTVIGEQIVTGDKVSGQKNQSLQVTEAPYKTFF